MEPPLASFLMATCLLSTAPTEEEVPFPPILITFFYKHRCGSMGVLKISTKCISAMASHTFLPMLEMVLWGTRKL
jgi:hypothetical protein